MKKNICLTPSDWIILQQNLTFKSSNILIEDLDTIHVFDKEGTLLYVSFVPRKNKEGK